MPRPSGRGSLLPFILSSAILSNSNRPISPTITRHGDRALDLPTTSSLWTLSPHKGRVVTTPQKIHTRKAPRSTELSIVEAGIATIPDMETLLECVSYEVSSSRVGEVSETVSRRSVGNVAQSHGGAEIGPAVAVAISGLSDVADHSPTLLTHELLEVPRTAREFPGRPGVLPAAERLGLDERTGRRALLAVHVASRTRSGRTTCRSRPRPREKRPAQSP